jgi:hypothetical protein
MSERGGTGVLVGRKERRKEKEKDIREKGKER